MIPKNPLRSLFGDRARHRRRVVGTGWVVPDETQHSPYGRHRGLKSAALMWRQCLVARPVAIVKLSVAGCVQQVIQPPFQPADLGAIEPERGVTRDEQRTTPVVLLCDVLHQPRPQHRCLPRVTAPGPVGLREIEQDVDAGPFPVR